MPYKQHNKTRTIEILCNFRPFCGQAIQRVTLNNVLVVFIIHHDVLLFTIELSKSVVSICIHLNTNWHTILFAVHVKVYNLPFYLE